MILEASTALFKFLCYSRREVSDMKTWFASANQAHKNIVLEEVTIKETSGIILLSTDYNFVEAKRSAFIATSLHKVND